MKRLEIIYKDGSSCNVSNNSRNTTNSIFKAHMDPVNPKRVKSATIFTYPIKLNKPLVLISNGIIINTLEEKKNG